MDGKVVSKDDLRKLAEIAWKYRENAHIYGRTRVGAAVLSDEGGVFGGCNVEHRHRSHDIHAEVNAISSMVANGHKNLRAIVIVAKKKRFTPCGACMDWIFEFGGPECVVAFQSEKDGELLIFRARELMPYYPE